MATDLSPQDEAALLRRLESRAQRLIEALPLSEDELRSRLLEKVWAQSHPELVDEMVARCVGNGLAGEDGHARALRSRLFNHAARLLARAPRTEKELRRRLAGTRYGSPEVVEDVMSALGRYGYVNDLDFAMRYAERRASRGRIGASLLRLELKSKGIDDSETIETVVQAAFAEWPESDAIDALIDRNLSRRQAIGRNELSKLGRLLVRRGFDPETVQDRLRELARGLEDGAELDVE